MERPLSDKRIIGPLIDGSNLNISAPIAGDNDTQAVCGEILDEQGDTVRDMVASTDDRGKEQIVVFVKVDGKMLSTDIEEGNEYAITSDVVANISVDATMLAINERGGGTLDPRTVKQYQVHTHPEGHIDFSTRDLTSIGDRINVEHPKNSPDGHFVAVRDGDDILLHGVYRTRELTSEEASNIKSVCDTVEAMGNSPITESQRRQRVIDELMASGYEACSSTL
jgi:hypothetical protein